MKISQVPCIKGKYHQTPSGDDVYCIFCNKRFVFKTDIGFILREETQRAHAERQIKKGE